MRKILLNKSKGKKEVNNTNSIPVKFNRDASLLHDELQMETFDMMNLYNNERDNSTRHRMIFTIYPICTNAIFNNITEIVYKEGSDNATILDNSAKNKLSSGAINLGDLTRKHAIRNTEYSNDKFSLSYHCGVDIFNNHLLRMKDSSSVQKRGTTNLTKCAVYTNDKSSTYSIDAFNTIGDYSRTYSGKDIVINMPSSGNDYIYKDKIESTSPLYFMDTIKSFNEAYNDGIQRKNGWIGFNNKTTMNTKLQDSGNYTINKCINNKPSCQFIDMSPERDLFFFTPKKNFFKNRVEYNWDVFITYPFKSEYNDGLLLNGNGIPLIEFSENKMCYEYISDGGIEIALFRSPVKHNLNVGDTVKLLFPDNSESKNKNVICKVIKLGTSDGKYTERYFSVKKSDFELYLSPSNKPIYPNRFIKMDHGYECEYYFRKFKKITKNGEFLKSTINKLAFSETIYGDEVSQIVFTDDVNVENLVDNRGRPITELFLTIIKTNRGHKGWYENEKYSDYTDNGELVTVEYSHVFGNVSSGLDMPNYVDKIYPTVRHQHNINGGSELIKNDIVIAEKSSSKLEKDITKDFDEFYGDLVEFNPITCRETVIEDVLHRFNTAQREYYNKNSSLYDTIYYDEIFGDIFDYGYYGKQNSSEQTRIREYKLNEGFANLSPEGYIYKPHHRVKISEFSELINQNTDMLMETKNYEFIPNGVNDLVFFTDTNYSLGYGDIISFFNTKTKRYFKYKITKYSLNKNKNNEDKGIFIGEALFSDSPYGEPTDNDKNSEKKWFIHNTAIPDFAAILPDGNGVHLWRNIKKPSEMNFTDELYDTPFTNGSFYHHKNITFPVKRQDPFGHYGMFVKENGLPLENNFEMSSTEFDASGYEHFDVNENNTTCF